MTNVDVGPGAIVCSEAVITGDVTIGDILQCNNDNYDDRIIEFRGECLSFKDCDVNIHHLS